jgi:hypothetical protein
LNIEHFFRGTRKKEMFNIQCSMFNVHLGPTAPKIQTGCCTGATTCCNIA